MLEKIKESLRIKHSATDNDLNDMILACKLDLKRVGIVKLDDADALIIQAVKIYIKWHLNFEGEADRFRVAYERLRDSLSMCGEYNV